MSKKDFIALADALRNAYAQANLRAGRTGEDMHAGVTFAQNFIVNVLAESNPRFKRDRWLSYIAGECGPNGGTIKKVA
jgi:hypothetical protein